MIFPHQLVYKHMARTTPKTAMRLMLTTAAPLVGTVDGVSEPVGLEADPEEVAVAFPAGAGSVTFVAGQVAFIGAMGHSAAEQMLWS